MPVRETKKNLIVDHVSNYNVTIATPKDNPYYAVNSFVHHCLSKLGPLENLIAENGNESLNTESATCRNLFKARRSPRTSPAP